jgi:hypothetical protein
VAPTEGVGDAECSGDTPLAAPDAMTLWANTRMDRASRPTSPSKVRVGHVKARGGGGGGELLVIERRVLRRRQTLSPGQTCVSFRRASSAKIAFARKARGHTADRSPIRNRDAHGGAT